MKKSMVVNTVRALKRGVKQGAVRVARQGNRASPGTVPALASRRHRNAVRPRRNSVAIRTIQEEVAGAAELTRKQSGRKMVQAWSRSLVAEVIVLLLAKLTTFGLESLLHHVVAPSLQHFIQVLRQALALGE